NHHPRRRGSPIERWGTDLHAYRTHRIGRLVAQLVLLTGAQVDARLGLERVPLAAGQAELPLPGDDEQPLLSFAGRATRARARSAFEHRLFEPLQTAVPQAHLA